VDSTYNVWEQRQHVFKWILAGVLLSLIAAYFYPKYEATVELMPPESGSSSLAALALPALSKLPGLSGLTGLAGDLVGGKNSGALFTKVMESRTIEDNLINRFDLRKKYGLKYWEDARRKLRSRTTITEDKKSGVLTIVVKDRDPQQAVALTGAYIEELNRVMASVATSSARRERIFLEQRLTEEKKYLEDSEKKFSHFASSTMMLDVPQQTRVTVEEAAKLQGELIAARAELEGLEQIFTNENFRVRALRARVAELERELARINAGQISATANQDPTSPYPSVKNLPVLGVEWADLYRTTKIHETVFELLTQQYEMARIQEAKEIPTVKVLDSPWVSERRYPRPWQVMILGVFGSAVLGCVWVLLLDWFRHWDDQDPRRILLSRLYFGTWRRLKPLWAEAHQLRRRRTKDRPEGFQS
jgi:capsule polysaccharide export protein KpsE/RkpR